MNDAYHTSQYWPSTDPTNGDDYIDYVDDKDDNDCDENSKDSDFDGSTHHMTTMRIIVMMTRDQLHVW